MVFAKVSKRTNPYDKEHYQGAPRRLRLVETDPRRGAVFLVDATTAPADASLSAGQAALWLDPTVGASKLMVKAKDTAGTVVTGSVTLT